MERSVRHVRHWALDPAKYFGVDPVVVKNEWSVGDVVEAIRAMETYEAIRAIREEQAKPNELSKGSSPYGRWL